MIIMAKEFAITRGPAKNRALGFCKFCGQAVAENEGVEYKYPPGKKNLYHFECFDLEQKRAEESNRGAPINVPIESNMNRPELRGGMQNPLSRPFALPGGHVKMDESKRDQGAEPMLRPPKNINRSVAVEFPRGADVRADIFTPKPRIVAAHTPPVGKLRGLGRAIWDNGSNWASKIGENFRAKMLETFLLVLISVALVYFGFIWAAIGVLFFMFHIYLPNEEEVMAKAREQAGKKAGTEFTSDLSVLRSLTEELKSLKEDLEEADKFLTAVTEKGDMTTAFAVRKEITEMKRKRDEMKKQRTDMANKINKKAREKANQKIIEEVEKIMAEA